MNGRDTVLRIAGIVNDSITDGPGLRLSVFAQGCFHNCPGCHNPQTHDLLGGFDITAGEIMKLMDKNPLLTGISLTGGEPFLQPEAMAVLAEYAREKGLSVIAYTGFLWEDLLAGGDSVVKLIKLCDFIVDGRYVEGERTFILNFRGSANQRVIAVKESLSAGGIRVAGWA